MKRSQAAMEFLLTYGWAIVLVLTAGVALWYYGVFDVSKFFAHETCTIEIGLSCLDSSVVFVEPPFFGDDTNTLNIVVKNNLGFNQEVIGYDIPTYNLKLYQDAPPYVASLVNNANPQVITITDVTNTLSGNAPMQKGDKYELEFTLTLLNTETKLEHTYHVSMTGKVI